MTPKSKKSFFEIVEFINDTNFDFSYYQTDVLMAKINHLKDHNNYQGTLLITDKDYLRGMARIFKVIGEDKKIDVKSFERLEEAIDFVEWYCYLTNSLSGTGSP